MSTLASPFVCLQTRVKLRYVTRGDSVSRSWFHVSGLHYAAAKTRVTAENAYPLRRSADPEQFIQFSRTSTERARALPLCSISSPVAPGVFA